MKENGETQDSPEGQQRTVQETQRKEIEEVNTTDAITEYEKLTNEQREDLITTAAIIGIVILEGIVQGYNLVTGQPVSTLDILVGLGAIQTVSGINITQLAGKVGLKF